VKQKVIFRVDANPEIGLGHLTRCLALAEMIIEDFECVFAIFLPKLEVVEQIRSIKSSVMLLSDEFIDVFTSHLTGNEIVILDGYNFVTS
jgi:UDP-2,4-diacetamido-2,4,6-trideoxy-beta-L-altropyranose hydrolase